MILNYVNVDRQSPMCEFVELCDMWHVDGLCSIYGCECHFVHANMWMWMRIDVYMNVYKFWYVLNCGN